MAHHWTAKETKTKREETPIGEKSKANCSPENQILKPSKMCVKRGQGLTAGTKQTVTESGSARSANSTLAADLPTAVLRRPGAIHSPSVSCFRYRFCLPVRGMSSPSRTRRVFPHPRRGISAFVWSVRDLASYVPCVAWPVCGCVRRQLALTISAAVSLFDSLHLTPYFLHEHLQTCLPSSILPSLPICI